MNNQTSTFVRDIPWPDQFNTYIRLKKVSPSILNTLLKQKKWPYAYLRWQAVRKSAHNIFFEIQYRTGFEGYFVGRLEKATQVADAIARIGMKQLALLEIHHTSAYSYNKKRRQSLMDFLHGKSFSASALQEACQILGVVCGSLRPTIPLSNECERFKVETDRIVSTATYALLLDPKTGTFHQHTYSFGNHRTTLPQDFLPGDPKLCLVGKTPEETQALIDGFEFMTLLGVVGMPSNRLLNELIS